MKLCEVCHKKEVTGTRWLTAEESDIHVAGVYQVCEDHGGKKSDKQKRNYGEEV